MEIKIVEEESDNIVSNIENLALLIKNEYTKKIILLTDLIRKVLIILIWSIL